MGLAQARPNKRSALWPVINLTDTVKFECIAIDIPPPAIQWGMLLTPEGVLGNGQSLASTGELNSRLTLGEPSQMMIPTPAGRIYQVECILTFSINGSDTDTYTCMACNINAVKPIATQNLTLCARRVPRYVMDTFLVL